MVLNRWGAASSDDTSGSDSDFSREEDTSPPHEWTEHRVDPWGGNLYGELVVTFRAPTPVVGPFVRWTCILPGEGRNTDIQDAEGGAGAAEPAAENLAAEKPVEEPGIKLIPDCEEIGKRLKDLINKDRKGLRKMYGGGEGELDEILKDPMKDGAEMARELICDMGCTRAIAKDLAVLTLYDVAILIDDSDSMIYEEGGARKETLVQFIDYITEIYSMANESGILAMTFVNHKGGKRNWTGKSQEYLDHHINGGMARIGTELKKRILDKFVIGNSHQSKPLLVIIVTDGVIAGERKGHLKNVIRDCLNEREEAGKGFDAVSFQFSLIGNDYDGAMLLEDLDEDREIGECIDVSPAEFGPKGELPEKWFVLPKTLLGAILPEWDEQDDHGRVKVKDHLAENYSEDPNSESDLED